MIVASLANIRKQRQLQYESIPALNEFYFIIQQPKWIRIQEAIAFLPELIKCEKLTMQQFVELNEIGCSASHLISIQKKQWMNLNTKILKELSSEELKKLRLNLYELFATHIPSNIEPFIKDPADLIAQQIVTESLNSDSCILKDLNDSLLEMDEVTPLFHQLHSANIANWLEIRKWMNENEKILRRVKKLDLRENGPPAKSRHFSIWIQKMSCLEELKITFLQFQRLQKGDGIPLSLRKVIIQYNKEHLPSVECTADALFHLRRSSHLQLNFNPFSCDLSYEEQKTISQKISRAIASFVNGPLLRASNGFLESGKKLFEFLCRIYKMFLGMRR